MLNGRSFQEPSQPIERKEFEANFFLAECLVPVDLREGGEDLVDQLPRTLYSEGFAIFSNRFGESDERSVDTALETAETPPFPLLFVARQTIPSCNRPAYGSTQNGVGLRNANHAREAGFEGVVAGRPNQCEVPKFAESRIDAPVNDRSGKRSRRRRSFPADFCAPRTTSAVSSGFVMGRSHSGSISPPPRRLLRLCSWGLFCRNEWESALRLPTAAKLTRRPACEKH